MRFACCVEGDMIKRADPFYKLPRWLRLRRAALGRDGWQCCECRRFGKRTQAATVHHIFPRGEYPEYQWDGWNLASLCDACHDAMHDRTTNALTEKGVDLLKRTARRRGMELPLRYRA